MSAKELTYQDIAEHNTKNDVYLVIHDKVYDASKFIDEHPYGLRPIPPSRGVACRHQACPW